MQFLSSESSGRILFQTSTSYIDSNRNQQQQQQQARTSNTNTHMISLVTNSGSDSFLSENDNPNLFDINRLLLLNNFSSNPRTIIGIRSLFERIFLGQLDFNRLVRTDLAFTSSRFNIGTSGSTNLLENTTTNSNSNINQESNNIEEVKKLMRIFSKYEQEYSDFRTYPLRMDWKEIEKGRSYAHEAMCTFGFLGANIYISLNGLQHPISYKKMPKDLLDIYSQIIKNYSMTKIDMKKFNKIKAFIDELPKLEQLEIILINSFISLKEYLLLTVLIHIYLHFYSKINTNLKTLRKIYELLVFFYENYLNDLDFLSVIRSLLSQATYKRIYKELKLNAKTLLNLNEVKHKLGHFNILLTGSNFNDDLLL